MAESRKRRYTCQEALSFLLGDIETLEGSNANVPSVKEIFDKNAFKNVEETDADKQSLGEQIDEEENEFQMGSVIPDIPTLDEINADIQNMYHKFYENFLQNITYTINQNVDFEINQMVQEENEIPDENVTKRRRKSCLEERKQNISIKGRSLGQFYLGKNW